MTSPKARRLVGGSSERSPASGSSLFSFLLNNLRCSFATTIVIVVALLLLSATIVPAQQIDQNRLRKREIVDVRIEGNKNFSSAELLSIIATRPSGRLEKFLYSIYSGWGIPAQIVDETVQSHDTLVIFSYYRDHGYLEAKVNYTIRESPESVERWQKAYDENRLLPATARKPYPTVSDTIVFSVVEGAPYTVDFFTFEGIESLPHELLDEVTNNISIKRGSRYTRQQFAEEITRFRHILEENGYPFFRTDHEPIVKMDTARKQVRIYAAFKTGPRIKNGPAHIFYDTAYLSRGFVRRTVVLRQISLDSGQWFRVSDIQNSERELAQLGVFELWRVELDTSAYKDNIDAIKDGTELPVTIFLRMRSTSDITPGIFIGVGNSSSGLNFGTSLSYSNRNLFDGGENFTIQGSYQFFPSTQKRYSVGGQLTFPYVGLRNIPLILSSNYSYSRIDPTIPSAYLEKIIDAKAGSYIMLSRSLTHRLSFSPEGTLEYVERIYYDTTKHINDLLSKNPQFNVLGSMTLLWDWTNDYLNPSTGSVMSYSPQVTLPFIAKIFSTKLPSASYWKNTLQFKTYVDPSNRGASVFAFRIYGGLISLTDQADSLRDISIERRFTGGGTNSLRAWPAQNLLVSNDTALNRPKLGGYKTIEGNIEWRYAPFQYALAIGSIQQFLSDVRLAVFLDVGNVWDRTVAPTLKTTAAAIGFGVHYNTLFGALRFDFGFKLYDPYPTLKGDNVVAIPTDGESGVWLFKRNLHWKEFGDVFRFSFALGQSF